MYDFSFLGSLVAHSVCVTETWCSAWFSCFCPQSLDCSNLLWFSPLSNVGIQSVPISSWWQYISLWDAGCRGILWHTRGSIVYKRHSIITAVTSVQQEHYLSQRKDSQQHAYLWRCYLLPKYHIAMSRKAAVAVEASRSASSPVSHGKAMWHCARQASPGLASQGSPASWAILVRNGKSLPWCAETPESSLCSKTQKYILSYSQREGVGVLHFVLCQSRGFQVSSPLCQCIKTWVAQKLPVPWPLSSQKMCCWVSQWL